MAYDYDRRIASSDIKVHEVEFASGQEPDDAIEHEEDFATLVRVDFTVGGPTLARLLKKQDRVLEKALKELKTPAALDAALKSREVLQGLTPAIKKLVADYVRSKGATASKLTVEFADEGDLPFRAKAAPDKKELRLELEFDVDGSIS